MLLWYHREQQRAHASTQRQTRTIPSSTTLFVCSYIEVSVIVIKRERELIIIIIIMGKCFMKLHHNSL